VAVAVGHLQRCGVAEPVLVFEDRTGRQVDFDVRGSDAEIRARYAEPAPTAEAPRGPGRPRLGVVPREVTLLPRHWEWLAAQPDGASATLRRLVDRARTDDELQRAPREAQQAADRFMMAMLGNEAGYEAAARALYAGDRAAFEAVAACWPAALADYARRLAAPAFMAS
jgi:hypothetical protein